MNRHPSPTEEEIRVALAGVFKSNRTTFFTIDPLTGEHSNVNVTDKLRQLGMSYGSISQLFKTFPFPEMTYRSPVMIAQEAAKGRRQGPKPKLNDMENENEPEDEATPKHEPKHRPYQIVQTSSGWWGIFSNDAATIRISGRERQDAERELLTLLKRQEPFSWAIQSRRDLIND
jgi:hypothetical protein